MPTILVVDDEQDLRELLTLKLQREGFTTLEAGDGLTGEKLALDELIAITYRFELNGN